MKSTGNVERLLEVMSRLREPERGCPWDLEQTFTTIAPFTIEEAYEVADVISREAWEELPDELGDLLFQVVFYAQMAKERGWFDFSDVHEAVVAKMVRRHPHVFADARVESSTAQSVEWEEHKRIEQASKGTNVSLMDAVPRGLASLKRAQKLQKKAASAGFDWHNAEQVLPKLYEELEELSVEIDKSDPTEAVAEELGDLLFTCANLARHLNIDLDSALRQSNLKFERRFRQMETFAAQEGTSLQDSGDDELERLWGRAKTEESSR